MGRSWFVKLVQSVHCQGNVLSAALPPSRQEQYLGSINNLKVSSQSVAKITPVLVYPHSIHSLFKAITDGSCSCCLRDAVSVP